MISLSDLRTKRNEDNFKVFNHWVQDFFRREYLRDYGDLNDYKEFCPAMREEVKYWNPNRSKHAEVYWLEHFVFERSDVSLRNKILNAMAVKFVGMPTLTLVASDTYDYNKIIDFDQYEKNGSYFSFINENLNTNKHKLKVWGTTQLQTSLQTAARNYTRGKYENPDKPFNLSDMIEWILYLDTLGLSTLCIDKNNRLKEVCDWLMSHRGIGPYFGYHPPCNFSRSKELDNINEDDDVCYVGPGALRGLQFVFPDIKFNDKLAEEYIISIKHNQHDFFEFSSDESHDFYRNNLENNGSLTTFGTEITFCQFNVFLSIKDNPKAQEKRIVPLTFDSFEEISEVLKFKMEEENSFNNFFN